MKTAELRKLFVDYFKGKAHTYVHSSSTIPIGDQTLLFTTAGMVQFKTALTGEEVRSYKRAVNHQKCVRVKDLDNVGKNGRHHTFFEMLGNWSFGDYYKKEAIEWAYDFVKNVVKMDLSRFWISVHLTDDEAERIWRQVGVPADRIVRLGADNFWEMGPTGPCGPCTELHIDQGPDVGREFHERTKTKCLEKPGCECDRFLEFWNLVFMQYDKQADGTLLELPFKSVDTGAGLERFSALLQGKTSNFDIDLFVNIKNAIRRRAALSSEAGESRDINESLNVVADHVRMLTFTLADGIVFSNEGRGYVLRRVLRRAVRHAHRLNPSLPKDSSFLADIVPAVVAELGTFYPEIRENERRVVEAIRVEEMRFTRTLASGLERFNEFVTELRARGGKVLDGEKVFLLHDTFGFPCDLTQILCEENGLSADLSGYTECMRSQKEKSRAEAKFYTFDEDDSPWITLNEGQQKEEKTFSGYGIFVATGEHQGRDVVEFPFHHAQVRRVRQLKNRLFEMVVANTPFYAESGGQTADIGWVRFREGAHCDEFELVDVRKTNVAIFHLLRHPFLSSDDAELQPEEKIREIFSRSCIGLIDFTHRSSVMRNHTATHLLQRALQIVVGDSVRQAGSMVDSQTLRFDFTHGKALTSDEICRVETLVNREILKNVTVTTHENVSIADAKAMGAMAIFDEKYDDQVRVVDVPGFSKELCGGTHVKRTGTIGLFKILSEGSVTAGVRRIEGVTGSGFFDYASELRRTVALASEELNCAEKDLIKRIQSSRDEQKNAERTIAALESRLVNLRVAELVAGAREISSGVKLVAVSAEAGSVKELELLSDRLKEREVGVSVVAGAIEGKVVVIAAVTPALVKLHKNLAAGKIVKQVCELVDGNGGGRPDFARGGGASPQKIPAAIARVEEIVKRMVEG